MPKACPQTKSRLRTWGERTIGSALFHNDAKHTHEQKSMAGVVTSFAYMSTVSLNEEQSPFPFLGNGSEKHAEQCLPCLLTEVDTGKDPKDRLVTRAPSRDERPGSSWRRLPAHPGASGRRARPRGHIPPRSQHPGDCLMRFPGCFGDKVFEK